MNKICLSILFLCLIYCINAQRRPAPAVQYPRYLTSSAIFNSTCPRVRKSWNSLTTADKTLYVSAFNRLKQSGLWDQFTIMHNDDSNRQFAHGSPGFFVWHRYFLFQFEEALRALGPQYKCLTLPYWPFEMEAGNEGNGDVHKYFGGPNDYNSDSLCVTFGSLRNWRVTADQTCLRRTWDSSYSYIGEARIVDLITSYPSYGLTGGFRSQIEGAPHAGVHNYVGGGGGHMGTMNSNADPFFYLLHANIDRLFAIWEDCHDYDRISGDISGRSWPTSDSNAEMPYVYNGQTHPLFTRANTKVAITPRSVYQLGTNVLPYLYDPNDRLVGLLESTAGDGICKFHWFNTATNSVSPKPATATATIAETNKRAVEAGNNRNRGRPSDYQRVHFWDNRVQKSYDSICVEEIPNAPKPYQIHATAIEECNICTSHGAKKHASDQWIVSQNMANEWIVFQPICSVNATNTAVVPALEVPVTQPIATQPTYSQPDYSQSQPQYPQPDYSQSQPQYSQPSYSQPQYPQSGYSQSGYSQPHNSQQYSQPDYSLSGYLQSGYAQLDYSQLQYQPNYGQQTYYSTNDDGDNQGYNGNNDQNENNQYDTRDDRHHDRRHDNDDDDRRDDRHHDRQHDDDNDRRDDRHDDRRHDRHDNDNDGRDDRHHDRRHDNDDDDKRDDRHHDRRHDDDDDRRGDRHDNDHHDKKHSRHHNRDERRHDRHDDDDDRREDREHKGDRY